ncbi:MAG: copper homeostasis membrane protein CopD [Steroidobacteraceae bacterium]
MPPDSLSVLLRSAGFIALFQAAGMTTFIAMFSRPLGPSLVKIRRVATVSAIAAIVLLLGQYGIEAARMADDMTGMVDTSLQIMVLHSPASVVLAFRILGLCVIAIALRRQDDAAIVIGSIGSVLVCSSFILAGHTVGSPLRWALAPLLMLHVTIVGFWFGALVPLYLVSRHESPTIAGTVTETFSRLAGWLVPVILAVGVLMGFALVRHIGEFRLAYGISLIAKFVGFATLMGLATLNKWHLGPRLASGNRRAMRSFRRSLGLEYLLIAAVLSVTAIMTTFYSPEP